MIQFDQGSASLNHRDAENAEITEQGNSSQKRPSLAKIAIGILALCLAACGICGWMVLDPNSPLNRASAINATQDWACLADLPKTASDLDIEASGSAFTREFTISFRDTPANISAWIAASPGPSSTVPTTDPSGWQHYEYPPCNGSAFAEIRISPAGDKVIIHTYWS